MQIRKLLLIAIKDLRLIFRDRSALVLMLLAPFVLTLGMGALTGAFSSDNDIGISNIPVVIVNEDEGELGKALVDVFLLPELADLVEPKKMMDLDAAKLLVDEDQSTAMIHIPVGFTDSIITKAEVDAESETAKISFYTNPTMPTSAGVLQSILEQFVNKVKVGSVSSQVIVTQLLEESLITPDQAVMVGRNVGRDIAQKAADPSSIEIRNETADEEGIKFNILAYMAPGMAVMFLMFTVTYGGRSLLVENQKGTLQRLLVAPTFQAYVLGGKAVGILLTAIAQMLILILGTSLLFKLQWGDMVGVILLILAAAFGATGWGIFFAAILKTPGQVAVTGSAVMLLFGVLGGSFFDLSMLPDWIRVINKITPNAWAIDGFYILSLGGKLTDILPNIYALLIMGAVFFLIAAFWIRKHGLARK
ncbi:MAG: ABC transporter permease [Chloroflexota bacterium]|nr:ABC transporter permease [Chloroflexota bacterium]